jgi:hypothetical protein
MFNCCTARIKSYSQLTTDKILECAVYEGLIDVVQYEQLWLREKYYPKDWSAYHPNLHLAQLPGAKTTHLSEIECYMFFIALMHIHGTSEIREMYKPPNGPGFESMIRAVASQPPRPHSLPSHPV